MTSLTAFHLSNALTYASLLCGVGALAGALQANAATCGALLALAVVFDTFDGRFARFVRRRPPRRGPAADLGAELDSLVDAVTFGIVPIACASVLFAGAGAIWWGSGFAYVACAVTRLGVYNVSNADVARPGTGFIGLPTPVAALVWSSLFLIQPDSGSMILAALALAVAMVSPVRIARPASAGLALFVLWPLGLIAAHASRL